MREPIIYLKLVINLLIWLVAILFIIFLLPKILSYFLPFVIGWVIAMIANPLVKILEKRVKIVRRHSSAIIIIGVLIGVTALLYLGVTSIVDQLIEFINDLPNLYTNIDYQFKLALEKLQGIYVMMPLSLREIIDELRVSLNGISSNIIKSIGTSTINEASGFAKNIFDIIFMTIIAILSAYFFIAERDNLVSRIKKMIPSSILEKYNFIVNNFMKALLGYFKAQFKIMLILIGVMFIGFEILGIGYSFLLALGVAFLDFLPIFGTGAVLWPWAFIDMLNSNYVRAIGLMVIYLICQIIKQVLQPKMVGDSIGISPLSTLIIMFIGYRIKGVIGMIFSLPVGMVLISFYQAGLFDGIIREFKLIIKDINEFRKI